MCVTSEVAGQHLFKGHERRTALNQQLAREDGIDISRMRGARNVTHVSRLQCVSAAVARQIQQLARDSPETRVVLIAFSDSVTYYCDGRREPVVVTGKKLDSIEELDKFAREQELGEPVGKVVNALIDRLWALDESGATALGPALSIAVGIASRGAAGSSVTLCTDGLANLGVGSLEVGDKLAGGHYIELAEKAKLHGVVVSILSLIGAECRLEALATVTEQSSGTIERINAIDLLKSDYGVNLKKTIVAHGAMAMVVLHRGLRFKGEFDDEAENRNWLVKDLGTVTSDMECAFRYTARPKSEYDVELSSVPFQLQLLYKRADGSIRLRVATTRLATTQDRSDVEKDANVSVVATHAVEQAAKLARKGDYLEAQMQNRCAQRFLKRANMATEKVDEWSKEVDKMDELIKVRQAQKEANELAMLEEEMNLCNSSSATTTTTNVPKSKPNAASCDEIDEDDLARRLERLRSPSSSSSSNKQSSAPSMLSSLFSSFGLGSSSAEFTSVAPTLSNANNNDAVQRDTFDDFTFTTINQTTSNASNKLK